MIEFIDTHSHLYDADFNTDITEVKDRSVSNGVCKVVLPAVDKECHGNLLNLASRFPDFAYPCAGLHPTSVNSTWQQELDFVISEMEAKKPYIAIVAYLMNAKKIDPRAFSKLDVESVVLDLAARLEKIRNDIAMSEKGKGGFIRWYCCENDGLFITGRNGDKQTMYFELIFTFGDKATNMLFDAYTSAQTKCIGDT